MMASKCRLHDARWTRTRSFKKRVKKRFFRNRKRPWRFWKKIVNACFIAESAGNIKSSASPTSMMRVIFSCSHKQSGLKEEGMTILSLLPRQAPCLKKTKS
jgi:hypothetical protein